MKILVVVLVAAFAVTVGAQTAPLETVRIQLTDRATKWYAPLPVSQTTADKAWWAWFAASNALTVADAENSLYALRTPGATEANPFFGARPGRARIYAVMLPVTVLCDYMSWRYKREDDALRDAGIPGHKYVKWWLPQALNAGGHAIGILVTLASTGR